MKESERERDCPTDGKPNCEGGGRLEEAALLPPSLPPLSSLLSPLVTLADKKVFVASFFFVRSSLIVRSFGGTNFAESSEGDRRRSVSGVLRSHSARPQGEQLNGIAT